MSSYRCGTCWNLSAIEQRGGKGADLQVPIRVTRRRRQRGPGTRYEAHSRVRVLLLKEQGWPAYASVSHAVCGRELVLSCVDDDGVLIYLLTTRGRQLARYRFAVDVSFHINDGSVRAFHLHTTMYCWRSA